MGAETLSVEWGLSCRLPADLGAGEAAGSSITAHCPGVYSTSIPLGLGESDSLTGLEVSA